MNIATNIQQINQALPPEVQLIAVSKFHPKEDILEAYREGQRLFGESKVQEMTDKQQTLPTDIQWHFIGHLQTNKIKHMIPYVAMIHGVDSYKLLEEINKQAVKAKRIIPCLLQIYIAQEETKFGFSFDECRQMLQEGAWKSLDHIRISGLMGMATYTPDVPQLEREFHSLSSFHKELKESCFADEPTFKELSMGMSDDYPLAIRQGSTLIRVGSKIFGERIY